MDTHIVASFVGGSAYNLKHYWTDRGTWTQVKADATRMSESAAQAKAKECEEAEYRANYTRGDYWAEPA